MPPGPGAARRAPALGGDGLRPGVGSSPMVRRARAVDRGLERRRQRAAEEGEADARPAPGRCRARAVTNSRVSVGAGRPTTSGIVGGRAEHAGGDVGDLHFLCLPVSWGVVPSCPFSCRSSRVSRDHVRLRSSRMLKWSVPEAFGLELDAVAVLEAGEAAVVGPGGEDVARLERVDARHPLDAARDLVGHVARVERLLDRAVHREPDRQLVRIRDLVRGHQVGADGREGVARLHLVERVAGRQQAAGRAVDEVAVAEDVLHRPRRPAPRWRACR